MTTEGTLTAPTTPLIVLGTGGNARDIVETISAINHACGGPRYRCVGFLDDCVDKQHTCVAGLDVLGPLPAATRYDTCLFVNGIGSPANHWQKDKIIARTGVPLARFVTLVHPSSSVATSASIGLGTVVFEHVTITSSARIGNHVVILPSSIVSHDATVDDYTCIAGGVCISGGVKVGKLCYLGTNCAVRGGLNIGDRALVGMGAVVLDDVDEETVVVGNPARFLRRTLTDS